jgi:hypothetical protein
MIKKPTAPPEDASVDVSGVPNSIYPSLDANEYCLNEIRRCSEYLEQEAQKRDRVKNKYKRGVNALTGIEYTLLTTSTIAGAATVATGATGIGLPIAIALGITSLSCAAIGTGIKSASKYMLKKAQKHNDIKILAETKLNTISALVAKSLRDRHISSVEFQLILDEIDKYKNLKIQIRGKDKVDKALREEYFKKGREAARMSFIEKVKSVS